MGRSAYPYRTKEILMATKIRTNDGATRIEVIPLAPLDGAALEPVTDRQTGNPRLVDGVQVYALRGVAVRFDGEDIADGATVKVKARPGQLAPLAPVALTGDIVITPWVADGGRQARLSIVADGLATSKKGD